MNREELKQIIRGVSVAVPTPFDKDYRLDLAAATDLTQWWVSQGLGASTSMIKLCSAWGQGPDISDDEWASSGADGGQRWRAGRQRYVRPQVQRHLAHHRGRQDRPGHGGEQPPDRASLQPRAEPGPVRKALHHDLGRHRHRDHDLQHVLVRRLANRAGDDGTPQGRRARGGGQVELPRSGRIRQDAGVF